MSNMYDPKLKNDGFILFFVKENTIYPIAMTKDQSQMLNILLPGIFTEGVKIINEPMGTPCSLKTLINKKEDD